MNLKRADFGQLPDGGSAHLYTLTNANGMTVKVTDYGATLVAVQVPDREGQAADILLGFDHLQGYLARHPYFGSTVGRFCNRIGGASFFLDGRRYQLAENAKPNHLHGGQVGFDQKLWSTQTDQERETAEVVFSYTSPHMEEGYPGTLHVRVGYKLGNNQTLVMSFEASCEAPTVLNLTNHGYWNLAGAGNPSVLDHMLM